MSELNWEGKRGKAKTSASWVDIPTCRVLIKPLTILSRTWRQSNSWKTGLLATCIAAVESQKKATTLGCGACNSPRRFTIQMNSLTAIYIALYSDSAEEWETTSCFLDFHEMRAGPKNIQKLDVERLVSKQDLQSSPVSVLRIRSEFA